MYSKGKSKKILRGIAITIIVYITVSMLATKFIYDSIFERYSSEVPQRLLSETESMFENEKKFAFKSGENTLEGMLYTSNANPKELIIFSPGLKAEVVEYEGVINAFLCEGFDVFAYNPTGNGKSGGDSSIGFLQIISDLGAAIEFADNTFGYEDVFLFGHSRGGFASCCVMNSYDCISAVATVNSTDTAMDAIMAYSTNYVGDIAYGNYFFLDAYQSLLFGDKLAESSSVKEINKSDKPIIIIQAKEDETITPDRYSLYSNRDKITSDKAKFVLYDKQGKSGHTTVLYGENRQPNVEVVKQISDFYKNTDSKDRNK